MPYTPPPHPIAAVTHPDPYPYYAALAAHQPIYYDDTLNMWIASSAAAVHDVLTSPLVRVRPTAEPVPTALLDSPAGEIFRQLIRMNDGAGHCPFKKAVTHTFDALPPAQITAHSSQWARFLMQALRLATHPERSADFAFQLPVYALADLMGVPPDRLWEVARWVDALVRCITPGSSPEQVERGKQAAAKLLHLFQVLLADQMKHGIHTLLTKLVEAAHTLDCEDHPVIVANAIGFLTQSYEATAGLIGNTLALLAKNAALCAQIAEDESLIPSLLYEVLRYDAPVQNTRRFVAEEGVIAGCDMQAGAAILVVLAAANHDAAANPKPANFDLFRPNRQIFTFGVGGHACPGAIITTSIAEAALKHLLAADLQFALLSESVTYRPSVNARIPMWTIETEIQKWINR